MLYDYRISQEQLDICQWNFKRIRGFMGLSVKDLAEIFGYSYPQLVNIENGKVKLRPIMYIALISLCKKFYNEENDVWKPIIETEFRKDFTIKRAKFKKYEKAMDLSLARYKSAKNEFETEIILDNIS